MDDAPPGQSRIRLIRANSVQFVFLSVGRFGSWEAGQWLWVKLEALLPCEAGLSFHQIQMRCHPQQSLSWPGISTANDEKAKQTNLTVK